MGALEIFAIPLLKDNYGYVLRDATKDITWVVDPSEAEPVLAFLKERGYRLDAVVNTHHHWDHVGGNLTLKKKTRCRIFGPASERERIPGLDEGWAEGSVGTLGSHPFRVLEIPGHTSGHIAIYFSQDHAVFTGDTLFHLGCGRLFEGTAGQMAASLGRLAALPDRTRVFCGHEYTRANMKFAQAVDPTPALKELEAASPAVRTIGEEKATNPFLRVLGKPDPVAAFAELRRRKDAFVS